MNTWKEYKKGELLMSKFKNEFKSFMEDMEKNIKNKEDLEYVKGRTSEFLNVILDQMEGIVNYEEEKISLLEEEQKQINEKMQKMQEEIAQLEVTGESGAGLVKITINGAHNCRRIDIDPSLMEDDKEMLEDLIAAAFNDAVRRAEELQKEKMASVTAGMPLPPGFKMPF